MNEDNKLYPLKFHPIIKEKIWGGTKLDQLLNKSSNSSIVGESWELSAVQDNVSIVANGVLQGTSLLSLIEEHKEDLVGKKVYQQFGVQFPLLIKFIDAHKDLSIQLHPNDKLAKERHDSFGKTEMWYVMQADEGANLIVDFKEKITKETYQNALENNQIEGLLNFEAITKGDSYFISAGKIHAIGKGALIAEIQQTSDITYRVYDWGRKDKSGNSRELHTELALDALDFNAEKNFKLDYDKTINTVNTLATTTYFQTNFIHITENQILRDYSIQDSFKVLMCVEGSGQIETGSFTEKISLGETILLPASISELGISSEAEIKLLEIYV